jgi:hypothetical protein
LFVLVFVDCKSKQKKERTMETQEKIEVENVQVELPEDLAALVNKGRTHGSSYPFANMKVGGWELLDPHEGENLEHAHKRVQSAVGAFRRNAKQTSFKVRIAEERGKIFVQRIEDRPTKVFTATTESK